MLRQGLDRQARAESPTAIALGKRSFNADSDNIRGITNRPFMREAVLRYGRIEGSVNPSMKNARRTSIIHGDFRFAIRSAAAPSVGLWRAAQSCPNVVCKGILVAHKSSSPAGHWIHPHAAMSPHLPVRQPRFAESARPRLEAGAASCIFMLAIRRTGARPVSGGIRTVSPVIKQRSNVVVNLRPALPYMTVGALSRRRSGSQNRNLNMDR